MIKKDDFIVLDIETCDVKDGKLVPVLNGRNMVLCGVWRTTRTKPIWFTKPQEVMDYLLKVQLEKEKENKNLYVYAHNHLFDLCGYGQDYMQRVDVIKRVRNRPLFGILNPPKAGEKKKPVGYLLDTLSFFPFPLEEVGKMLGIKKREFPKEINDINELKPRCYMDMKIVMEAIRKLKDSFGKLGWTPRRLLTISTSSMTYFKTECRKNIYCKGCDITWKQKKTSNPSELNCPKCGKKGSTFSGYLYQNNRLHPTFHNNFLRDAYYGSRNEVGIKGEVKGMTLIDMNSQFPHCMANLMEVPDLRSESKLSKEAIRSYSNEDIINNIAKIGVVEATIFFPERKDKVGYLPVRVGNRTHCINRFIDDKPLLIERLEQLKEEGYRIGDLIEKVEKGEIKGGIGRGKWNSLMLRTAIKEGYKILKIHNVVRYDPLPFNPFIILKNLYERRLAEKDDMIKYAIKLLMNSLYGKFGQTNEIYEEKICHRKDTNKWIQEGFFIDGDFNENYIMKKIKGRTIPKFAHPMISLTTTAIAHDLIYKEISKIPKKDFVYTDCDSIIMKNFDKHKSKFKFGMDMGEWKIVAHNKHELINENGFITREKVYRIRDREIGSGVTKMSGFRPKEGTRENLTDNQVKGKEPIVSLKMYTPKMGTKNRKIEKIGTFFEETKRVSSDNLKMDIIMPIYFECGSNSKGKIEE